MKDDFTGKSIPNIEWKDSTVSFWKVLLFLLALVGVVIFFSVVVL